MKKGNTMKKTSIVLLAMTLLLTSFISCSRRNNYEDQLEEQSTHAYEKPLDEQYDTPTIHKSGSTPYYSDKSVEDLETLFLNSSRNVQSLGARIVPTGVVYQNSLGASGTPQMYFYNKLTGNISAWCADPLCTHELEKCVWSAAEILYIGTETIVFESKFDTNSKLYTCDLQRNHVQELYDITEYYEKDEYDDGFWVYSDMVIVDYVYDNLVYVEFKTYSEKGSSVTGIYTIDLNTREFKKRFEIPNTVSLQAWIGDSVIYRDSAQNGKLFRADLNFENSEVIAEGDSLAGYTDRYLVVNEYEEGERYATASYVYDLQTEQTYDLPDVPFYNAIISGEYIYYKRNLTEEEMENDSMKDYYTWEWEYKRKRINAQTQGAGKVYRVKIGENTEECVLQLTYKDVPVRIESIAVDGEVVFFTYHHYEQFKNYLNQDFPDSSNEPLHYAVADLQNGTVKLLNFTSAE